MPNRRFKDATRRVLKHAGRDVTVTNYTDDGTVDRHGDPTRTVDSETTETAILRQPSREELTVRGPAGNRIAVEVEIFLPDTVTVHPADEDGNRYATEITDSATNETYRVVAVWNEGNGQVRVAGVTAS